MKWIEVRIEIHGSHGDQVTDLIASVFYDLGSTGVVIEDPELTPFEGWAENAVERPDRPAVTGYLPVSKSGHERLARLYQQQKHLSEDNDFDIKLKYREIDEEDWAESWKEFFRPVKVSRDLIIKPSWESVIADPGTMVIDIDPGMAFGTGTHPTTILCLRLIQAFMVKGSTFLDVGTGSGILSIAAAKYGAGSIVAVDTDEAALSIAAENLVRNGVQPERCLTILSHLLNAVSRRFDIVVANILTNVIIELIDDLHRVMEQGGIFICSGIIPQHRERVVLAMRKRQFDILAIETLDGWVGFAAKQGYQDPIKEKVNITTGS